MAAHDDERADEAAYDRWATDYRDFWAPVIAPAAVGLLDRLDGLVPADRPATLVDIGTGTGTLALAALRRWPQLRVVGVDPARRLLAMARERARSERADGRLTTEVGEASRLPLGDASADAAASSFVLQLTPSRTAAVREAFRVLRPGGAFAHITWRTDVDPWEPEDAFDDALDALRIEPASRPDGGADRSYTSAEAAAAELRKVGFRSVDARDVWLEHQFTPRGYVNLAEHWTEDDTFATLDEPMRKRLRAELLRRLERVHPDKLVLRRVLVSAVGVRPG